MIERAIIVYSIMRGALSYSASDESALIEVTERVGDYPYGIVIRNRRSVFCDLFPV